MFSSSSSSSGQESEVQNTNAPSTLKLVVTTIAALAFVSLAGTFAYKRSDQQAPVVPSDAVNRVLVQQANADVETDAELESNVEISAMTGDVLTLTYPQFPGGSFKYENNWDGILDVGRKDRGGLCQVRSVHHNLMEDRLYGFGDCKPLAPGVFGNVVVSSQTGYDAYWTRECPSDKFMVGIWSQHSNIREDRVFRIRCAEFGVDVPTKYVQKNCGWDYNWVNNFDAYFVKTCPKNKVLTGVKSYHHNGYEDRRFKFECCNIAPVPGTGPSTGAAVCRSYPNPSGTLIRGRRVRYVDVTAQMKIEFKITITRATRYWLSILHIGVKGSDRNPAIYTKAGYAKQLHFAFNGEEDTLANQVYANIDIEFNKEYAVKIETTATEAKIYFDDVLQATLPLKPTNRKFRPNVPVFLSAPSPYLAPAKVTGLIICSRPAPPTSCKESLNTANAPLTQKNFLFNTKTVARMDVSLTVKITAWSTGWASVFHIGKSPYMRLPGIWTPPNNSPKLYIAFNGGQTNSLSNQQTLVMSIELNKEYEIKFRFDGTRLQILWNGQPKGPYNLRSDNRNYLDSVPVFAGNPNAPPAKGIVTDVKVCLYE